MTQEGGFNWPFSASDCADQSSYLLLCGKSPRMEWLNQQQELGLGTAWVTSRQRGWREQQGQEWRLARHPCLLRSSVSPAVWVWTSPASAHKPVGRSPGRHILCCQQSVWMGGAVDLISQGKSVRATLSGEPWGVDCLWETQPAPPADCTVTGQAGGSGRFSLTRGFAPPPPQRPAPVPTSPHVTSDTETWQLF